MTVRPLEAVELARAPSRTRRRGPLARRRELMAYAFLLPAVLLLAVFTLVPFVQAIVLSFQQWDGVSTTSPFVGLSNYTFVLHDSVFWSSMRNVLIFGVAGFVLGNALSLGMAIAVNRVRRGKAFFRTAFYLPGVFSVVVIGMMFSWLLAPNAGIVNRLLGGVGLSGLQHNWLEDPGTALPAVAAVFLWYHWGFGFILYLAGLQDVPVELYEAADLDGAGGWAKFRYVTWPDLLPVTAIVSLLTLLGALQVFGTVQVLTNGGPGDHTMVPTLRIYQEAFTNQRFGSAAAMSVIFGGALVLLAMLHLWLSRRRR
ncbi:sugar ABC transporter permease [Kribbella sp. VKM Ac-2569]|uniref:carbohydrate ABC transporter permease n=1 Tax=Kribbella sp. VKM Ac-2569 TaxID=2512220 RepID=UPI00102AD3CD|nr:sugar ABC transporter permease [Kribbella sp. VKM Ac-2569]